MFRKQIAPIGQYAPTGIRFTIWTDTSNINGASGIISGCYFYKIGRKNDDYLGNPDGNNGLGVIDFYARGREIIITNNQFIDCLNSGVRGKTNIDSVSIGQNIFRNTPLAINIVPNTFPTQVGNIVITDNVIENSDQYSIAVVGNSTDTPAFVQAISICNNAISNTTNITPLTSNLAAIVIRYIKTASITGNVINGATNSSLCGISAKDIEDVVISSNNMYNVGKIGIFCETLKQNAIISNNYIDTTGSWGIAINGPTTLRMVSVCDNTIDNCNNYGVIQFTTIERLTYIGNTIRNVTGLSRAFYVPDVATSVIVTGNTTNATTPLYNLSRKDVTQELLNSWNPIVTFGTAIPTTGTWTLGSIIYDSTPTAAGNVGWVCVTAGTPGTWKTFGTIAA